MKQEDKPVASRPGSRDTARCENTIGAESPAAAGEPAAGEPAAGEQGTIDLPGGATPPAPEYTVDIDSGANAAHEPEQTIDAMDRDATAAKSGASGRKATEPEETIDLEDNDAKQSDDAKILDGATIDMEGAADAPERTGAWGADSGEEDEVASDDGVTQD